MSSCSASRSRLECEVAFAAFQTAHVGPVDAQLVGEGFLRESSGAIKRGWEHAFFGGLSGSCPSVVS